MNPFKWLLAKGSAVVKIPGKRNLISPLPYWNTKISDDYDLGPYIDESVTSLTLKSIPEIGWIDLNGRVLSCRNSPEESDWQCALLLHVTTNDAREEYTVLIVDSGFKSEKVDDTGDTKLLSGMSDFYCVVHIGDDEKLDFGNGLIDLGHTYSCVAAEHRDFLSSKWIPSCTCTKCSLLNRGLQVSRKVWYV